MAVHNFHLRSLTPILTARFMLNLRQAGETNTTPSRPSRMASVVFRIQEKIIGNMGEPLDHGFAEDVEDGEVVETDGVLEEQDGGTEGSEGLEHERDGNVGSVRV